MPFYSRTTSFYENASFGRDAAHFFPGGVGFLLLGRSPQFAATAVANTPTVATLPVFIRGGELEEGHGALLCTCRFEDGRRAPSLRFFRAGFERPRTCK